MVKNEFGAWVCVRCHLSDDRFLTLDEGARSDFIDVFLRYLESFEISWNHDFALISLFMDAARIEDDPPLILSKKTIGRGFYNTDEIVTEIAKRDPYYLRQLPDGDAPDDEDTKEETLREFYADNDRWFRGLEEDDPRCMLYAMRSFFTFLNPTSSIRTDALERNLVDDRFMSLDTFGQQLVVTEFLNYIDDSDVNRRNNHVLTTLFSEAVSLGNPYVVSKKAIAGAIRARETGKKKRSSHDTDHLVEELETYESRCVLEAMRSIFAFLNPGSPVRAGTLEEDLAGDEQE